MTNSDLRNPAHYARLSREFPGGAEYANIVRDLTNKTIHVLDRALADGFEVAAHVPDSKRRRIEGVICFDSKVPKIIPL
ncbi:MAG TPA: hypothetical protein VHY79_14010, partial [Rhizomicrobium sp.]|nr:hypothetical protein [Rhizomicrobium sp.]